MTLTNNSLVIRDGNFNTTLASTRTKRFAWVLIHTILYLQCPYLLKASQPNDHRITPRTPAQQDRRTNESGIPTYWEEPINIGSCVVWSRINADHVEIAAVQFCAHPNDGRRYWNGWTVAFGNSRDFEPIWFSTLEIAKKFIEHPWPLF